MGSKKKGDEVATIDNTNALANIDFGEHTGVGTQNMTSADQAIPFLSLLQALSKCISDPAKKVEGAAAGMIMNSVSKELYSGEEGVAFIPCNTTRCFIEWEGAAGSGTPVNRYSPNDPVVIAAQRKFAFNELKAPSGNKIEETFLVVGVILDDDMTAMGFATVSFASTKIKAYKESIGELRKVPGNPPLYAFPLRLTSKSETRPSGTSYNFVLKPLGYTGDVFKDGIANSVILPDSDAGKVLYPVCKQIADDFDSGAVKLDYESNSDSAGGGGSEDEPY